MNLHQIARGPVSAVNAEEQIYLIQAIGQRNEKGRLIPEYAAAELVSAQVQSFTSDELQAVNDVLRTAHLRKFYLFAQTYAGHKPEGQYRLNNLPEDFIYRTSEGTYWKVFAVQEDYAPAGWVCLSAALQQRAPDEVVAAIPAAFKEST